MTDSGDTPLPTERTPKRRWTREGTKLFWGSDTAQIQVATLHPLPSGALDVDFLDKMIGRLNDD